MRHILLIGGAGYIGAAITKYLLENNMKVRVLDNFLYKNADSIHEFLNNNNFSYIKGDLCKQSDIQNSLDSITDVVILGGLVGDPITKKYPELNEKINVDGVKACIDTLNNKDLKKVIFISTCSNYGLIKDDQIADENFELKPLSLYAKAKVEIEKFILEKSRESIDYEPVILRFATAFGESSRMRFDLTINEFIYELLNKKELMVYDPDTWRPYCHVLDFARLISKIIEVDDKNLSFEIFNAGSDKNNFTKRGIVNLIASKIEGSKINFKEGDVDPRNYKVNFKKLETKLNFKTKYNVEDVIDPLIKFIKSDKFHDKNLFGNYHIEKYEG
jgi:nucleoside-diphosphate-sugar epimerase